MTHEQQQYLNDMIYTPLWREKVAQYSGIQFDSIEEDAYARNLVNQFRAAENMRKHAAYQQHAENYQNAKAALYHNMTKMASYAVGAPEPDANLVSGYDTLYRMVQDPKLAACLDAIQL